MLFLAGESTFVAFQMDPESFSLDSVLNVFAAIIRRPNAQVNHSGVLARVLPWLLQVLPVIWGQQRREIDSAFSLLFGIADR